MPCIIFSILKKWDIFVYTKIIYYPLLRKINFLHNSAKSLNAPDVVKNKMTKLIRGLGEKAATVFDEGERKNSVLAGLEESLHQVKQIREGKLTRVSLKEGLTDI